MPLLAALFAILCAPADAQTYKERRDALVDSYLAEARDRLGLARTRLEAAQELMLTPHAAHGPTEAALLHLDLAEAALAAAEPTLAALPDPGPPRGWTPFEERRARALAHLRAAAPDLAAVYERVPLVLGPLSRTEVGRFEGAGPRIVVRGYHALAAVTPEYLATLLAHEAVHALQWEAARARGERFRAGPEEEAEARRRQSAVWEALGSPADKDFEGAAGLVAEAARAGTDSLMEHVDRQEASARDWDWVTPAVSDPLPPVAALSSASAPTGPAGMDDPPAGLSEAPPQERNFWFEGSVRIMGDGYAQSALGSLDSARGMLGAAVELAAPYPLVVNYELVQVWALQPRRYPPGIYAAFQALHPVMTEIDRARAALAAREVSEEDRLLLARYARARAAVREWPEDFATKALKSLPKGMPKTTGLASTPVGRAATYSGDSPVVVPGAWVARSTNTDVAGAWAAHVLTHRAQNASEPTLEQELEAVEASLAAWRRAGADSRYDKAHPDRFLRFRVARENGGRESLRAYLESLGFAD